MRDPAIAEMTGSRMAMAASAGPRAGTERKRRASARHAPAVRDRLARTSLDIRRDQPCTDAFGGRSSRDSSLAGLPPSAWDRGLTGAATQSGCSEHWGQTRLLQPSHRPVSGSCLCCMDLVYHGCWLVTCSSAMPDDRYRLAREGGQDERLGQPGPGDRCGLRLGGRASALVIRCPGPEVGAPSGVTASLFAVACEGPSSPGMPRR